jgi:uncharacterized protein YfkK (UPF0435 family)
MKHFLLLLHQDVQKKAELSPGEIQEIAQAHHSQEQII